MNDTPFMACQVCPFGFRRIYQVLLGVASEHAKGNRKDGAVGALHRQAAEGRSIYGRDVPAGVGQQGNTRFCDRG